MCRESIGVNTRSNVQVQIQPSDKQQGTLLLFTYYCMSVKYNKKQKGERKVLLIRQQQSEIITDTLKTRGKLSCNKILTWGWKNRPRE